MFDEPDHQQLQALLDEYHDIFKFKLDQPGASWMTNHKIKLMDLTPVRARVRHVSPAQQAVIN